MVGLDNQGFPGGLVSKESTCNAEESRLDPWVGKIPREGNGYPLIFLHNPMDRGAWWAAVHGVSRVRHNLMAIPPPDNL